MQTFGEALAEFIEESERLLGKESREDRPPPHPAPLDPDAVPVPSALILTEEMCRRYAHAIGDDNPLYTDPAYGERSWLGSQTVPGTVLIPRPSRITARRATGRTRVPWWPRRMAS